MASGYDSTTQELFDRSQQALALASLSAGRISLNTKPALRESLFNYTVPNMPLEAPPKFSDLFDANDNSQQYATFVDDQVDEWLAKYFPSINNGFTDVPDEFLMNVLLNHKPFGIDSSIFELVWFRARDRAGRTTLAEQRTLEANFSARGFNLPPGALVAQLAESERRSTDAILDVVREQAVTDAQIKNDILKMATQVAAQLKMGLLNTSAQFFRSYLDCLQMNNDRARIRAQAYQAYYGALASYYGVDVSIQGLKLRAATASAEVSNDIDRNRIAVFASDGTGGAHAQAARGFADVSASAASAAGTLVAQIESVTT